jgi:hypothetical protein
MLSESLKASKGYFRIRWYLITEPEDLEVEQGEDQHETKPDSKRALTAGDLSSTEKVSAVHFDVAKSVKLDFVTLREIEIMALFERKKPATFMRDVLVEKVRTYSRYPAYLRFRKAYAEKAMKDSET